MSPGFSNSSAVSGTHGFASKYAFASSRVMGKDHLSSGSVMIGLLSKEGDSEAIASYISTLQPS